MNSVTKCLLALICVIGLQGCFSTPELAKSTEDSGVAQPDVAQPDVAQQADPFVLSKKPLTTQQKNVVERVKELMETNDWSGARETLSKVLVEDKLPSSLWMLAGDIERSQGEQSDGAEQTGYFQQAKAYYQSAVSANSSNYHALNRLGATARQLGQFRQALAYYDQSVRIRPTFAKAYLNRGILYDLYLGDKPAALRDYQHYQQLNRSNNRPENRLVKGWLADLNRQLAKVSRE